MTQQILIFEGSQSDRKEVHQDQGSMEPRSTGTAKDGREEEEKKKHAAAPAMTPGAVRVDGSITEPSPATTSDCVNNDTKVRLVQPASKPGVVSVSNHATSTSTTSDSTTTSRSERRATDNEKAPHHSPPASRPAEIAADKSSTGVPASRPGAEAVESAAATSVTAEAYEKGSYRSLSSEQSSGAASATDDSEKARYRGQPGSRPGAAAVDAETVSARTSSNKSTALPFALTKASEPGNAVTTSSFSSQRSIASSARGSVKGRFRAAPAGRPGAVVVAGIGGNAEEPLATSTTPSNLNGSSDDTASFRSDSGEQARSISVADAGAAIQVVESDWLVTQRATPTVAATQPGAISVDNTRVTVESVESDLLAKKRANTAPLASKPGATPVDDADDAVQTVDSDLLIKQRASVSSAATQPGAISATDTADAVQTVESDLLVKHRPSATSAASQQTVISTGDAAVEVQSMESDFFAKQRPSVASNRSEPGAFAATDAPTAIQVVESDLLLKQGPSETSAASQSRVISANDAAAAVPAVESDLLAKQRPSVSSAASQSSAISETDATAEVQAMESDLLVKQRARLGQDTSGGDNRSSMEPEEMALTGAAVVGGDALVARGTAETPDPMSGSGGAILAAVERDLLTKVAVTHPSHAGISCAANEDSHLQMDNLDSPNNGPSTETEESPPTPAVDERTSKRPHVEFGVSCGV